MEMTLFGAFNSTAEISEAANYPFIRLFTVGQQFIAHSPLSNLAGIEQPWSVAGPSAVSNGQPWSFFSATCWFFGRQLFNELQVPIGLVSSNWGGTIVQAWSSDDAIRSCQIPGVAPVGSGNVGDANPNQNSVLWNAMIHPLLPMRLKGAIWYQGESNVGIASNLAYVCQFPAMIQDWRKKMNSDDFHFYFVQLAPFWSSDHAVLAQMRLAQMAALSLPYVGMGTAFDLGDANSTLGVIHPRNKQTVGLRLARAALNMSFGKPISWLGPYAVASRYFRLSTSPRCNDFANA
eukprot:TRINITY_DN3993_c0_g1_i1.p1 TRINITY_DN3993_c0_g1~~TRINITY_DN3993_c0_g1_i1.p1  ORF type:complete len:315 (+),score=31.81 TRINITY_DN3993_c0_g1_i1:74-946(+)